MSIVTENISKSPSHETSSVTPADTPAANSSIITSADPNPPSDDAHILENLLSAPDYHVKAAEVAEEMWQEYSEDTAYFDRLESLEYWDDEDEMYEQLAAQYEVSFAGKGATKVTAGPKQGKVKRAEAKTEAIRAAGGIVEGKGRGREEVQISDDDGLFANVAPLATSADAPSSSSAAPSSPPQNAACAQDASRLFDPKLILEIVKTLDKRYEIVTKSQEYARVVPADIPKSDLKALVAGYDHMMRTLSLHRYKHKYGGSRTTIDLKFGDPVPNYFANVGGESMYQRKAYSIAGLRNLLRSGAGIYSDLSRTLFYFPTAVSPRGALTRMREETGNVVDLDTVVLRNSSTTVNMINACNKAKGLPTYSSSHEFGDSSQAKEMAINLATVALNSFQKAMRLSDAQMKTRAGHPSQINPDKDVPLSTNNTTRGHVPLWRYMNCGQDTFHANCPELEDVVGALLRAPLHCVYHYAYIFSGVYGPWPKGKLVAEGSGVDNQQALAEDVPKELVSKLDAFFEDCVADSCFNRKWRAIEEFGDMLAREGTMTNVLQLLQMRKQKELMQFYAELDAEEREEEERAAETGGEEKAKESLLDEAAAEENENDDQEAADSSSVDPSRAEDDPPSTNGKRNKVLVVSRVPVPPSAAGEQGEGMGLPANSLAILDAIKMQKEIDFIYSLVVAEGGLKGRDPATGHERFITRGDVAAVVRAAANVL